MIDIKSTSNLTRFSTPINEGSKRKYTLMKEDYIILKFSVENPVYFKLGDYVDESFGLFELVDLCKPTLNESTGGYDYELRLDAYYWKWKNKKFFYSPEVGGSEAGWNLTATLDTHMRVFLRNLEALGYTHKGTPFSCKIDSTVELSLKLVSYDNTNLIDALTRIAETWECEWWIIGSEIRFGRCEFGEPVDFDLSTSVSSMSRSDSKTSYATRVYAFGSTRNIPSTYRKNLIFDVKEVNGRNISDTARKLDIKFFPENVRIESHKIPISYDGGDSFYTSSHPVKFSRTWEIAGFMQAGQYKLTPDVFRIGASKGGAGNLLKQLKATLGLIYSVNGNDKTIVIQSKEDPGTPLGTICDVSFSENTFTLEEDATNCRMYIDSSVDFEGESVNVDFHIYCKNSTYIQCTSKSANALVTFTSGGNKGQTFNAAFNPDFLTGDAANIIRLPEGIIASLGDTYTIDNIIRSKVPSNYFSKSSTELTVEGVVTNRLMLPVGTNCVNAYEDMTQEEAIEDIVIFEDVYPRRVGTMEEVKSHKHEEPAEKKGEEAEVWDAYRFKDSELMFSEEYVLSGQDLEIVFQSGALNGMKFVVAFNPFEEGIDKVDQPEKNPDGTWNTKAQVFEIKRNTDYGRPLPDSIACPKNGDKYLLSGFDPEFVLDTMIPEAEKELLEKAQKYVEKSKIDPSTYDCKMKSTYIYGDGNIKRFDIGDRVNLINKAYFDNGRQSRIIGFEYPLDIPFDSPIYTVGETAAYSRIGEIEDKIENLTFKGQTYTGSAGGGGSSVYVIGKNDKTSPSDRNVFSAVRTLSEILANNEELKKLFLGKYGPDQTDHLLKLLGGALVEGGITADSITSDTANIPKFTERSTFEKGATTLNLLVQELADTYDLNVSHVATMMRTIIKDYVSSETFIPGLTGEGMKIYRALNGDWNLEIDNVVVRKVMTIFELVISKLRSVNGGLVVSAANGRIKSVGETTGEPTYYVLGIEGDMQFVADDLVRCQVFTSGQMKFYWVPVASVTADSILVLKSEFPDGVFPVSGDDLIQMGNLTNKSRQGVLYLTASEDGKPRFSVLDGVNSTSTVGKSKVILGCLDGITDTDFPADFQPSGYGLYAMNVFLKGVFILRNGKSVEDEVNAAKDAAQDAKDKADAVTRLFQEFTVAGGLFESKITEVKTYTDNKVDEVQVGGRNLILNSDRDVLSGGYHVTNYYISEDIIGGVEYSITIWGIIGEGSRTFDAWAGGGVTHIGLFKRISSNQHILSFVAPELIAGNGNRRELNIYTDNGALFSESTINKIKLERGTKATDWTPAPEDVAADAQAKADTAKQEAINDAANKYPTRTEVTSSINQKADEINLSVTEKISNVQVGGRNYYRKDTPVYAYDGATVSKVLSENGLYIIGDQSNQSVVRIANVIDSNGYWTVSFDLRGSQGTNYAGFVVDICDRGGTRVTVTPDNDWRHHSVAVNVENYSSDVYNFVDFDSITWAYIYVRNIKIERGNKATDWTPAPEDVQSQITANSAAIEVNRQGIALKASQTTVDGLGNRLSTAESTLGVQAGQISAQVSSISSLTGRMSSAEAKITDSEIRLTVVSQQATNTAIEYANLAAKLAGAKMLYRDPTFKEGMNSIGVYNNSGNGTVSVSRVSSYPDNPTGSAYQIRIVSDGFSNSPNRGGFYFGNHVHIYSEYICKIIAWIPVGSNICFHSNNIGDGGYQKWLTPTAGQGKWAEYVSYVRGGSQNTSSTNYYAIDSPDQILTWWLCYATVFECSIPDDTPTRDEVKAQIQVLSDQISLKVTAADLTSTGIDVSNRRITLTADKTVFQNNSGQLIALFENDRIKADLIDARAIVTGSLIVEQIAAGSITADKIRVADLEVTKLKGATGSFKKLTCVSNSNQEVGAIEFGSDGKMWFSGDIYHQGYNSTEGRSHRFYASDLWCRGEFGHYCMTKLEYSSGYTNDVFFHIYNYGVDTAYHKYAKPGQAIDCIVLNGSANYVAYVCDSSPNKMVAIVNASGADKRIKLNNSGATETVLAYSFKAVVTGQSYYFNGFYINNLLVMR